MDNPEFGFVDPKVKRIRDVFQPAIGMLLTRYETAELRFDDMTWGPWDDLPIRLFMDSAMVVSVAWSKFDELWLSSGLDLPFEHGMTIRWITNSKRAINGAIGQPLKSVMLGCGQFSIEGEDIEIWTRLVLQFGDAWLEVFNALDENGFDSHSVRPTGTFIECI